jgi:acetyl esterase/lipase
MVVFTPTWIAGDPFPITSKTLETWDNTVSCAVAFAQQHAAEYGGDPTNTIVDGFSAGAGAALLFASQDPRVAPIAGCETAVLPAPVTGFVIGDAEAWLHSQNFDGVFASELDEAQARLAALIGPGSWDHGAGAVFHLWVAENGTNPRTIGDPSDDSGWFAQRDPDRSIQADLERLDQFADGVVTYVDAGQLLNLRLAEAGIEATLDLYPGGHTTLDKVPEIVGYLQATASP